METTETPTTEKPAKQLKPLTCPFTILIDSAEQFAFPFTGLKCDADKQYRPLIVNTERRCLGRHPDSLGDYSLYSVAGINGAKYTINGVGRCHIERKNVKDLHSTLLGFADGHRKRFECELENLRKIEFAAVIVEGSKWEVIASAPEYGKRGKQDNAKILNRSIASLQYKSRPVIWEFCHGPRHAELTAFYWLKRWYEEQVASLKAAEESEQLLATL